MFLIFEMSKTNFNPSNKFIYNGDNGTLDIEDIYVMKNNVNGITEINDLKITGSFERETTGSIMSAKGDENGIYFD